MAGGDARHTPPLARRVGARCPAFIGGVFRLVRHEYFEKVFVWLIVLNTGLMATDYHSLGAKHMGETHKEVLAIANIAFVTAFGLEVGLKLLGLGFDEFARPLQPLRRARHPRLDRRARARASARRAQRGRRGGLRRAALCPAHLHAAR